MNINSSFHHPHLIQTQAPTSRPAASNKVSQTDIDMLVKRAQRPSETQTHKASQLPPPMPPRIKLTPELEQGAESFVNQIDAAVSGLDNNKHLSPDRMMTEFLKLNLLDPNNSVDTHNMLSEAMSTLRQKSIDESLAASERAQEMRKEAEEYAGIAAVVSGITSVLSLCGVFAASLQALLTIQAVMSTGVNQALNATIKTAVEQGIQKALKQVGKNASDEVIAQAIEKAVKEAVTKASEQAVSSALEGTLKKVTEQAVADELSKQVVCKAIKAMGNEALKSVTNTVVKKAAQEGIQAATESFVFETVFGVAAKASAIESGRNLIQAPVALKQSMLSTEAQDLSLLSNKYQSKAEEAQSCLENENSIIQALVESKNQIMETTLNMIRERGSVASKINGQWAA